MLAITYLNMCFKEPCTSLQVGIESLTYDSPTLGTDTCDNPNTGWKHQGQSYYWVTGGTVDYTNAKAECEKVTGGQLAEVMDKATLEYLYSGKSSKGEHGSIRVSDLKLVSINNELINVASRSPKRGCRMLGWLW